MKKIHVFKRLWTYIDRYRYKLLLTTLVALAGVVFEISKPLPIKVVIDNVLTGLPLSGFVADLFSGTSLATNKIHLLYTCVVVLALIGVFNFLLTRFVFILTVSMAQRLVFDLMIDFYAKLQRLSLSFYAKNKVGDLLQRMSGDVFVVYFLVAQILLPAITSLVCLAGMFYIMASIDLLLALIAFSVVPLLALVLAFFAKPMNISSTEQYKTQGHFSAFLQQSLSSMKIIQAFGRESYMHKKLTAHAEDFSNAFIVANRVSMTYGQLSVLITVCASALLILIGATRGLNGTLSIGDLFIFLGYLTALYGPVNSLSTAIGATIAVAVRGKRVFDILDSEEVVKEKPGAIELKNATGEIEFRNVTFGYGNALAQPVLQNISFKVLPGQVVAIVGATGSGKTSLISLLSRFYDPWKGSIYFDGIDTSDIKLHSLRENISLVLQEPFIFPMTIAENIAFGNPEASLEEIVEAAKGAQAHAFISKLPEGYNTVVSESGTSLSGGEKQRLAIARAFLKNAPVLVLDEPTSAVDAFTEAKIFKALAQFTIGKTVFLISHRLSTIKHADQIITIKDGQVVERGTHQSLLKENKVYAGLYKYQHIT